MQGAAMQLQKRSGPPEVAGVVEIGRNAGRDKHRRAETR
jgi:hypothetical protein